jgi:hypothetical protein
MIRDPAREPYRRENKSARDAAATISESDITHKTALKREGNTKGNLKSVAMTVAFVKSHITTEKKGPWADTATLNDKGGGA